MTLEEKFQPAEIDRLKVENEALREQAEVLAKMVLLKVIDETDVMGLLAMGSQAPRLFLLGLEWSQQNLAAGKKAMTTGEVLCLVESVLTPNSTDVRTFYDKIK